MSDHYDKDGKKIPPGFAFFMCSVCGDEVSATGPPFANKETGRPECTMCHFNVKLEGEADE